MHDNLVLVSDRSEHFQTLGSSLRLIEAVQPIRYSQISRDLSYIWVTNSVHYASFLKQIWACAISSKAFEGYYNRPEDIALVIIHEATHARLEKLGVRYDEMTRARIEAICHRRELSFAKLLADERAIYVASYYLQNPIDYSDDAVDARRLTQIDEISKEADLPQWATRLISG